MAPPLELKRDSRLLSKIFKAFDQDYLVIGWDRSIAIALVMAAVELSFNIELL